MNLIFVALFYVITDPFFWPSMAFTTMIGVFIGAVVYNGDVTQIKRMLISLSCYALLIIAVNASRILPQIGEVQTDRIMGQPFASIDTVLLVTIFYLLGNILGVKITRLAHKK